MNAPGRGGDSSTAPGAGLAAALTVAGISAIHGPAPAVSPPTDERVVITDKGPVRGTVTADLREFQGIPYAAPPVRWGSPRPAARWTEPRDATAPEPRCAHSVGVAPDVEPRSESEDCLYLNVTTPRHPRGKKLPVMVWIHGSGFRNGAGDLYRPQKLAKQGDVVVVTFNYRLGFFGFLAHPALDGGPAQNRSGNFGLEDQQEALRWVQPGRRPERAVPDPGLGRRLRRTRPDRRLAAGSARRGRGAGPRGGEGAGLHRPGEDGRLPARQADP